MRQERRVWVSAGVLAVALVGWAIAGHPGATAGFLLGLAVLVIPWWRQPLWAWAVHYLRRARTIELSSPATVANDLSSGGIRYQDGVAIAAVQVLGKPHRPTLFTGATATRTDNVLELSRIVPMMRQSLGLEMESVSVVTLGARRRSTGDYSRVYDTLLGTPPYAGTRETWLVLRIRASDNADALRWRATAGSATLAAAQRLAAGLRREGIRTRVATAADIIELDRRLGCESLQQHNRRWHTLRSDAGWLTTYAYRPEQVDEEVLAQAWSIPADGVIQNLTLFPDGNLSAAVTLRTPQPPTAPPSVALQTLPGEQAAALAASLCAPLNAPRGLRRGAFPPSLSIDVGPSGVLLGKVAGGNRLLLPLGDPQEISRVILAAEDHIAKRVVIRAAAAGERVTVHTTAITRWESVRMPQVVVTDQPRPAPGTTLSVIDGSVVPAPRPHTVIEVVSPRGCVGKPAQVEIRQTGPATVDVYALGQCHEVEVELFRAENRYVAPQPMGDTAAALAMAR